MPRKKETLSEFLTAKRAEVQSEDVELKDAGPPARSGLQRDSNRISRSCWHVTKDSKPIQ